MKGFLFTAALGATAMFFLDPDHGKERRTTFRREFDKWSTEADRILDGRLSEWRGRSMGLMQDVMRDPSAMMEQLSSTFPINNITDLASHRLNRMTHLKHSSQMNDMRKSA